MIGPKLSNIEERREGGHLEPREGQIEAKRRGRKSTLLRSVRLSILDAPSVMRDKKNVFV